MTSLILLSTWMESQVEIWLPIQGFEGYDVSSFGRVRSWWQGRTGGRLGRKGRIRLAEPRILNANLDPSGYRYLCMYNNAGIKKYPKVHRLVAFAFVSNPDPQNKDQVNHLTGLRSETRANALEWSTRTENMRHGIKYLAPKRLPNGIAHHKASFNEQAIRDIRYLYDDLGWVPHRIAQVARTTATVINRIVKREAWKHLIEEEKTKWPN